MFTKEKVLEAIKWAVAGRLLAQIITWSVSLLVLRFIAPDAYGSFMVSQLIISFLIMLGVFGIDKVIVQSQHLHTEQKRQLLFLMILISWTLAALLFSFSHYIANFYDYDDIQQKASWLALALLLTPWITLAEASLDRELQFKHKSIANLIVAVICSLITLALVFMGFGVWSLIISYLIQRLLLSICYCSIAKSVILPSIKLNKLSVLGLSGSIFLAGDIVWLLTQSIDGLLGAKWYGVTIYGYFALALHLSSLILNKLMPVFNQTLMSFIARIQDDKQMVFTTLSRVITLSLFITVPVFWGLAISAKTLIPLLLGETWTQSAILMSILCFCIPLKVINSLISMTLLGIGKSRTVVVLRSANLGILVVLLYTFSAFDYVGLAYAVVCAFGFHFLLNLIAIKHIFNRLILPSFKPLLFGLIMLGPCASIVYFTDNDWLILFSQIGIGASIYVVLMAKFESKESKEIIGWFK